MFNMKNVIGALLALLLVATGLAAQVGLLPVTGGDRSPLVPGTPTPSGALRAQPAPIQAATATPEPTPEPTTVPAPQPRRETRALWVSRWDLKDHPDVRAIVDRAAEANMNVILFQVRGQADALYPSSIEPWAADMTGNLGQDPGRDVLAELVQLAHARGIEVHAWVNVYPAWMGKTAPAATVTPKPMYHDFNARYGAEWLQWKDGQPMRLGDGDGYLWANPAHPAVSDRVVAVCKDLLERYELDGLHLDYIRYAGPEYSTDPVSNQAYAEAAARQPGLSRADWQRAQVTALVTRVRDEALPVRPNARLTTTAWPVYQDRWGWYKGKDGYGAFYQDSQAWARDGVVSGIMPMLYGMTLNDYPDRFQTLARDYVDGSRPGAVITGIGTDYADFTAIADRIDVARQAGAQGQALFSFRALEEHGHWAALRAGPYAEPAVPSWR